jgi:hypothetical protein
MSQWSLWFLFCGGLGAIDSGPPSPLNAALVPEKERYRSAQCCTILQIILNREIRKSDLRSFLKNEMNSVWFALKTTYKLRTAGLCSGSRYLIKLNRRRWCWRSLDGWRLFSLLRNISCKSDTYSGKGSVSLARLTELFSWVSSVTSCSCRRGRAIAQAVSRRLPTVAARVRSQIRSCGISDGERGTGAGFLRVLRFPLPIVITQNVP